MNNYPVCNNVDDYRRKEAIPDQTLNHDRLSDAPYYPTQRLIENANDIVAVFSVDGIFCYASPSAKRILGYSAEDVVGHSAFEFVHPEDRGIIAQAHQQALQHPGERQPMVEYRIHKRDGSWCWLEAVAINLIHDPEVGGIVVNCHDITSRKRATEALIARERYLATLVEVEQTLLAFDVDEQLYSNILEILGQAVDASRAYIFRNHYDSSGCLLTSQQAEWCARAIVPQLDNDLLQNLPIETYLPRWVEVLSRGDIIGGLVADFPAMEQSILDPQDIQSIMVVPILVHGNFLGFIGFDDCDKPRVWDLPEIDLISAASAAIAMAQERQLAFQHIEQQVKHEQLLNQINRVLSSSFDPEFILQEMLTLVGVGLSVDRAFIYRIQDDQIQVLHEWRLHEEVPSIKELQVPLEEWFGAGSAATQVPRYDSFHAPDYAKLSPTPVRNHLTEILQTKSVLCAPVTLQGQVYGGIAVHTTATTYSFTSDEIQLLKSIADQVAIALYNAHSYERLEQQVRERTRQLQEEKHLSEVANHAKSDFLASMSHELRTPLNAVLGLSQVLLQQVFGDLNSKQQDYLTCIHSSGEHLLSLINDILDLSKIEAGKAELIPEILSVSELCQSCLTIMREQAHNRGLTLSSQLDPKATNLVADQRRVRQMLLNLLSNAVKFTPAGSITLIVTKQPNGIAFTVADTGIGLSAAQLDRLFQPFSQVDHGGDRRSDGTGLGLYLTRSLAQLHGGDVAVESTPNVGSQFTIFLPDRAVEPTLDPFVSDLPVESPLDQANSPLMARSHPLPLTAYKILLVEDDDKNAMLLRDYLSSRGYDIEHIWDGQEWLAQVRRCQPHLVLLDMQLPNPMTGIDLLVSLRQDPDFQRLPVVMVTAQAMRGDRERFLAAGATDYLSKPIDIVRLEAILRQHLSPMP